jgi:hypothetical protein
VAGGEDGPSVEAETLESAIHGMELIIGVVDPHNAGKSMLQHLNLWNLRIVHG